MTWAERFGRLTRRPSAVAVAALALVSFVPALASSPGRMPADTKLYLYLDPGGLVGRAASTFEPDQFAGWVPHQQITYLWPSGPWFWLFDTTGVPDWIAHRLWIGSIMFLAGSGVLWMARQLGLGAGAAFTAALLYQLSPFLLPYISRTSLLLLPWAGLGWIVGLTIRATAGAADARLGEPAGWTERLRPWREPALIALVVATVGSANATALALVAPGPVLWLIHAAWGRIVTWRAAALIAARTAVTCTLVSLWWMAMLVVQARHGAPVLAYSETLADVSRSSTGSEVLRSLGYWLFYIRDPFGPATSASFDYLVSTRLVAVSYAVTLAGLCGVALTSSPYRRFAALLVGTGMILAVGVHPLGSPSPLMSLIADDDGSGLALALRSSTRAVPLFVLGLAIGAGSLVAACDTVSVPRLGRWRPRTLVAALVVALVAANAPSLWRRALVDPAIDRDQSPPAAWIEAAAALGDRDARVLQLPGAEFGAFRWGYTVDQPLAGLSDRPLVTRDLLPLGSAGAMDLLYALDDRFQEGTIEAASVAPVARLLGADTVWVANDIEFERFRTPRPELVDDLLTDPAIGGSGGVRRFGEPFVSAPAAPVVDPTSLSDPRVGTPLAPVTLVGVEDAAGIVRAKASTVVLAGSGDGIVDAAAAGLLSGHELILYSASLPVAEREAWLAAGAPLVVTDSNRDRAHHWRGSQDVHGHTEPGGPADDVLVPTNADQRLDVFGAEDPALQTIAVQNGPVTATASAYGEPFAYLPEHRAVMAIDGDPSTAWLVGDHGDPVGERIALVASATPGAMTLRQPPPPPGGRRIDAVRVTAGDRSIETPLTDESAGPTGQRVELPTAPGPTPIAIEIEITSVTTGDRAVAASRAGVGFAEIDLGLGSTTELIRPPADALAAAGGPLAIVLTRLRADPLDRWRSDPEPRLARVFSLPERRTFEPAVTLRLDRRADDATVAALAGVDLVAAADRRLTGAARNRGAAAVDGDPSTSWITPIDGALGSTLTIVATEPLGPALELTQPAGELAAITALRISDGRSAFDVAVPPPDAGGRSAVELPAALEAGTISFTITGTDGASTTDRRFGDPVALPAAIADLAGPGVPVAPPGEATPVTATCTPDLLEIDGQPVGLSFETTLGALLDGEPVAATICAGPLALAAGEHRVLSTGRAATGLTVDRVVLSDGGLGPAPAPEISVQVDTDGARQREVTVGGCPDGCWLVDGNGFNEAWSARVDGAGLGPPVLVDGGFNGWWLPPAAGPIAVDVTWTAQTPVTLGLIASGLAVLLCLAVVALTAGRRPALALAAPALRWGRPPPLRSAIASAIALVAAGALLVGPEWGAIATIPAGGFVLLVRYWGRPAAGRALELAGLAGAALVALAAIVVMRRNRPLPDAGWTESFEQLNGLAVFSIVCLTVGALGLGAGRDRGGGR